MKKALTIFLFAATFLFLFSTQVKAQSITISPLSGNTSQTFTVTGSNFERRWWDIRAYKGNTLISVWDIMPEPTKDFTKIIGPFTTEGNYKIIMFDRNTATELNSTATHINITGVAPLDCGDFCPPPLAPGHDTSCPISCPCTSHGAGIWKCGAPPTPVLTIVPTHSPLPDVIPTALGLVDVTNPTAFVAWLLRLALGIGGGIAFLLMLIGAFQIMISSGNPERVQAGKELITSALAGLLLIIFSVFLLELIGVKILAIPGFK